MKQSHFKKSRQKRGRVVKNPECPICGKETKIKSSGQVAGQYWCIYRCDDCNFELKEDPDV